MVSKIHLIYDIHPNPIEGLPDLPSANQPKPEVLVLCHQYNRLIHYCRLDALPTST